MVILMQTAEDQWVDRYMYSERGWGTNDLSHGLRSYPLEQALDKTFISTNPRSFANMMVLDVDDDDAERLVKTLAWDDQAIPEPNWMTVNPASGHAHIGYWLQAPVCTTEAARIKPMRYAAAIHEGLRRAIPGDPGYTGRITRSPFAHPTTYMRVEMYDLRDLAAEVALPKRMPRIATERGLGRNCTLFDDLRACAYKEWRQHSTYASFQTAVQMHAEVLSIQFVADPLPTSEVRAIAKSVATWVWKRFDHQTFTKIQTARSRKRRGPITIQEEINEMTNRTQYEQERAKIRAEVISLYAQGLTYRQIAERMDLRMTQVRGHIQYARRLGVIKRSEHSKEG